MYTKTKLEHYYSSRVDYRSVESFLENSQITWCIYSTVGDGSSSFHSRVHYTKCLAHGNAGEATPTTTVGILRPLI